MASAVEAARNGAVPARRKYSTPPSPYTSTATVCSGSPRACSGAMYAGVPTTAPLGRQHLDGHLAVQAPLAGPEHDAHAAAGDLLAQLEVLERRPDPRVGPAAVAGGRRRRVVTGGPGGRGGGRTVEPNAERRRV